MFPKNTGGEIVRVFVILIVSIIMGTMMSCMSLEVVGYDSNKPTSFKKQNDALVGKPIEAAFKIRRGMPTSTPFSLSFNESATASTITSAASAGATATSVATRNVRKITTFTIKNGTITGWASEGYRLYHDKYATKFNFGRSFCYYIIFPIAIPVDVIHAIIYPSFPSKSWGIITYFIRKKRILKKYDIEQ
jgi:hypothetical protein